MPGKSSTKSHLPITHLLFPIVLGFNSGSGKGGETGLLVKTVLLGGAPKSSLLMVTSLSFVVY